MNGGRMTLGGWRWGAWELSGREGWRGLTWHVGVLIVWLAGGGVGARAGEGTVLLKGATVHTVSGPSLAKGEVLIEGSRIKAVGVAVGGEGGRVVELGGMHVYPGLIASSSTLGLIEVDAVRATRDTTEVGQYTPEVGSWWAVNPDSELIPVARANGITHALVVPGGGVVAGRSGLIQLDGWTTEQMTVRAPVGLHVYWPSAELDLVARERGSGRGRSVEEQVRERRLRLRELDEFFLEAAAYGRWRGAGQVGEGTGVVPAWEAMGPFVRGERPVFVHADGVREIRAALAWGVERKLAVVLVGGQEAWRVAGEIAARRVPVIYEGVFTLPGADTDSYADHFRAAGRLHEAGVKVSFGTAGRFEASSLRNLAYLAAQSVAFGLPEEVGIKGLTLHPAEALGVADRLGSIEVGKEASLVVADGPILDIRSQVRQVWIAGREQSMESRHTRLYERYRRRP